MLVNTLLPTKHVLVPLLPAGSPAHTGMCRAPWLPVQNTVQGIGLHVGLLLSLLIMCHSPVPVFANSNLASSGTTKKLQPH